MTTLEDVMTQVENALSSGQFERLGGLDTALEDGIRTLRMSDGAHLAALHAKAQRLSRKLAAAAEGVRAASWRLADIRAMGATGASLVTYDGQGRRADAAAQTTLSRRL
ncbi:hypothetical protein [Falsirhodobacter sp. alg1]|uniref:hypothetical protein n=1 Tax=Falsirhodobacter sp. alg1 TaxID=1472418 RepID=UPI0005F050E4|nr:hypothetical protein [Falsirhodobacter sp. alg1]